MEEGHDAPPMALPGFWGGEGQNPEVDEIDLLPKRLVRYGEARKRALTMRDFILSQVLTKVNSAEDRDRVNRLAYSMSSCGSWLLFRYYYTAGKCRLHRMVSCKKASLCPLCAIRKAAKALRRYVERWEAIKATNAHLRPIHAVFTVKNGEDLGERFDHLQEAFRKLLERRRDREKKGRGGCELNKMAGAVYAYEVTNRGKGWHPHIHLLGLVDDREELDFSELRRQWKEVTGDSFEVHVEECDPGEDGSYGRAFVEVLKYNLKFGDLSLEQNWHAHEILKGKRMLGSFGLFRGVKIPTVLTDDELAEDLPFVELLYRYIEGSGYNWTPQK